MGVWIGVLIFQVVGGAIYISILERRKRNGALTRLQDIRYRGFLWLLGMWIILTITRLALRQSG